MRTAGIAAASVLGLTVTACGGGSAGTASMRMARQKTLAAKYLAVRPEGRLLLFSPALTVIASRGRVIAWTARSEEFTR